MRPISTCRICQLGTDGEAVHFNCAVAEYAKDAAKVRRNLEDGFGPLLIVDGEALDSLAKARPERQPFTNS
jgi:hypothetical protein